jgi:hypothetical protein
MVVGASSDSLNRPGTNKIARLHDFQQEVGNETRTNRARLAIISLAGLAKGGCPCSALAGWGAPVRVESIP